MKLTIPPKARPGPVPKIDWEQFAENLGMGPDSAVAQAISEATGLRVHVDSVRRARVARGIPPFQKYVKQEKK